MTHPGILAGDTYSTVIVGCEVSVGCGGVGCGREGLECWWVRVREHVVGGDEGRKWRSEEGSGGGKVGKAWWLRVTENVVQTQLKICVHMSTFMCCSEVAIYLQATCSPCGYTLRKSAKR